KQRIDAAVSEHPIAVIELTEWRFPFNQPFELLLQRWRFVNDAAHLPDHDDERVCEGDVAVPYPFPVLLNRFLATFDPNLPQIELHRSYDFRAMTARCVVDRDVHPIEMRAQTDHLGDGSDPMQLHHRPFQPQTHPDDFRIIAPAELRNAELEGRAVECAIEERWIAGESGALDRRRIEAE